MNDETESAGDLPHENYRCGAVALVGRPNVGKSTLLNALIGFRLSIVSPRPQTTRHRILGIATSEAGQVMYVDTPGLHRGAKRAMNRSLNRAARTAMAEVDLAVQLIEAGRFVEALREVESLSRKRVAYIGGIDLCHVGPQFGDPLPVDESVQDEVRAFDASILARAEACDARGWFEAASRIGNRWRVCGLAATYTMLRTIGPARGRVLHYDQAVDGDRTCCVSFASMAFHADEPNGSDAKTA
jgi:small GTP-binding protein